MVINQLAKLLDEVQFFLRVILGCMLEDLTEFVDDDNDGLILCLCLFAELLK